METLHAYIGHIYLYDVSLLYIYIYYIYILYTVYIYTWVILSAALYIVVTNCHSDGNHQLKSPIINIVVHQLILHIIEW